MGRPSPDSSPALSSHERPCFPLSLSSWKSFLLCSCRPAHLVPVAAVSCSTKPAGALPSSCSLSTSPSLPLPLLPYRGRSLPGGAGWPGLFTLTPGIFTPALPAQASSTVKTFLLFHPAFRLNLKHPDLILGVSELLSSCLSVTTAPQGMAPVEKLAAPPGSWSTCPGITFPST